MNETEFRAACAEIPKKWVGLGWGDNPPGRQKEYLDVLFPNDQESRKKGMGRMSSCGLTALAYLRAIGYTGAGINDPYSQHIGQAMSMIVSLAKELKAYQSWKPRKDNDPSKLDPPAAGDVLIIWMGTSVTEHAVIVTGWDADSGTMLTVEGGAADPAGGSQIVAGKHTLVWRNDRLWCTTEKNKTGRFIEHQFCLGKAGDPKGA